MELRTISVPEAGRWLGLGRNASYEAARRGDIPTIKIGRLLHRKRREVQTYEWLKANGRSKALKKIVRDLQAGKPTPDVARRNPEANGEPEFRRRF
jgi:hypothetical protein